MFWKHNPSPQIDTVLFKEGLTLQELLNEDSILQELKSQNKKLIEFLTRPDILEEMITLITTEPSEDTDERIRFRHPNIVCELLTVDLPFFAEKIINDENLLSKLYSFLESDPPLNPLLASFFSRTMGTLVTRGQEQNWYSYQFICLNLLEFLKNKGTCIPLLMKHLGTSAIMDLTLKLVTNITEVEMRKNALRWLDSQELVQSIIGLLDPSVDADRHSSASQLLCDIITKCREAELNYEIKPEPNPILNTIESPKTVDMLLQLILCGEKCETSIVGGITVLLTLLEPIRTSGTNIDQENQNLIRYSMDGKNENGGSGDHIEQCSLSTPPVILTTIEAILPYLPQLHDLLINPPKKPPVKMNSGTVDPPLGNTRLHVAKLLSALVATHNIDVNNKLTEFGTIGVLLDLFFTYTWNNFLHTQVEKCLAFALNAELVPSENSHENILLSDIFIKCQLIQRILSAWNDNDAEEKKPGGFRRGYMGHLIRIVNHISSQYEKGPLGDFLKEVLSEEVLNTWSVFVNNSVEPINKIHQTCLGGVHPSTTTSQDESSYNSDNPLQDSSVQQSYNEYNTQEMAPQFVENFGFHENEFNDADESLHPSLNLNLKDVFQDPFDTAEEVDIERQAELFQQVCSRRLNALSNDDDDEDDGEDKQWSTFRSSSPTDRLRNGGEGAANYNSSDDEERPGPEGREEGCNMEIDQVSDVWGSTGTVDSVQDPWAAAPVSTGAEDESWADFESNFGMATNINPDESSNVGNPDRSDPTGSMTTAESSVPLPTSSSTKLSVALPKEGSSSFASPSSATTTETTTPSVLFSDNNANPTRDVESDAVSDESKELMDNFRFLSSQGLMAAATNGEITVDQQTVKSSSSDEEKSSIDNNEIKLSEDKLQPQPELEKVVVSVSATATAAVTTSSSDNRNSDDSISPEKVMTAMTVMDSSA